MIGYNVQYCIVKRVCIWLSASQRPQIWIWQPMIRRRTEHYNHASAIVLNIEIIISFFFFFLFCLLESAFKIHLAQKSEGARALNGHDGKYTFFYRVTSSWDTRCYSLIPSQRSKYKILDLIIESAIRESGEKRSSLEMSKNSWFAWQTSRFVVCSFVFKIQQAKYLNAKMFTIVWIKLRENLNIYLVTILTKAAIIYIIN